NLARLFISLLLVSPLLILILKVEEWSWPTGADFYTALTNTVIQSLLSAIFALLLGGWGAMGLLTLGKSRPYVAVGLLLPTFLPTLFVLLACFQVFQPFPFGMTGIVLVHTLIYSGLLAVIMARLIETK